MYFITVSFRIIRTIYQICMILKVKKPVSVLSWDAEFDLWYLDLVENNIPVLHSLSPERVPKINKIVDF